MKIIKIPRIIIASHRGGAGKTIVSLGLLFSLKTRNFKVACFKKGPDYIDAGWLSSIAGRPCRNLDLFILTEEQNLYTFYLGVKDGADVALIEGNRGLYDGVDWQGSCSSAQLA
ncbi:MAG: hydrogenobyrinic acid a,c-diamide synthase (glutamine-hydrolyzing), partial [Caldimicrobium sp.]|nr:hydrogenobyrinic acid a,c-diamide synthase (glutamine-hydrolyzing) [Caldimicrobium sp.]